MKKQLTALALLLGAGLLAGEWRIDLDSRKKRSRSRNQRNLTQKFHHSGFPLVQGKTEAENRAPLRIL